MDPIFISGPPDEVDGARPTRKRNRKPLSCNHCRIRKLRCSRTQPCEACTRSGDKDTCSFAVTALPLQDQSTRQRNKTDLRNRVDQLESLLLSVVEKANGSPPSAIGQTPSSNGSSTTQSSADGPMRQYDEINNLVEELGVMKIHPDQHQSAYLGATHWVSILCEVQELKEFLECNVDQMEQVAAERDLIRRGTSYTSSLFGSILPPVTRESLLEYLPPRATVDRLVDRFFFYYGQNFPILHQPSFRRECKAFREDGSQTQKSWLVLLIAVLYASELSYADSSSGLLQPLANQQLVRDLKVKTVQAIHTSNVEWPEMNTLQALMIFVVAETLQSVDSRIEPSLTLTMAIRLAMRMGLHRDARSHGLSPFQGEMRRRLWMLIHTLDILTSFMLGLPSTIRHSDCTAALPRNIHDEDFDEDTKLLPQSRPLRETTVVSYSVTKMRLMSVLGRIMNFLDSGAELGPEQVQRFDAQLHEAQKSIPPSLRISPEMELSALPTAVLRKRLSLDRLYLVAQCMLHRKFLAAARHDQSKLANRRKCVDSALRLLSYQTALYVEGGPLSPQTSIPFNITAHDFYLAGIAVALDLHFSFQYEPLTPSTCDHRIWGYDRRVELITALENSNRFYELEKDDTVESAKAFGIFTHVISRAKTAQSIVEAHTRQNMAPSLNLTSTSGVPVVGASYGLSHSLQAPSFSNVSGYEDVPGVRGIFDWASSGIYQADDENLESLLRWEPSAFSLSSG